MKREDNEQWATSKTKGELKCLLVCIFPLKTSLLTVIARFHYRSAVTKHKTPGKLITIVQKPKRKALGMNGFYTIELRLLKEEEQLKVGNKCLKQKVILEIWKEAIILIGRNRQRSNSKYQLSFLIEWKTITTTKTRRIN